MVSVDFGSQGVTVNVSLSKDGNMYCALFGDNLQEGVAGFGKTALDAVGNFRDNFRYEEIKDIPQPPSKRFVKEGSSGGF